MTPTDASGDSGHADTRDDTGARLMNEEIEVACSALGHDDVWLFFDEVWDVTDLSPGEERAEAWGAMIGDERVGMAVLNPDPSDHTQVYRVAVNEGYRRLGVGTGLLSAIHEEHGRLQCYVKEHNRGSQGMVEGFGFEQVESRYPSLRRYDTAPPTESE